jgi:hypothetical protein
MYPVISPACAVTHARAESTRIAVKFFIRKASLELTTPLQ